MSGRWKTYVPPGLVAARFQASDTLVRGLMGPLGSGKTGACLMDILHRAMKQAPHPDGVRRSKWLVVRSQQRDLEGTTIPSWHSWVPKDMGHWTGGSGGVPARHELILPMRDRTTVETEVHFLGLGEHSIDEKLPGWEGTGAYINEATSVTQDTITWLFDRLGRYPAVDRLQNFPGASWYGLWLDFNAPDTDHWLYDYFCGDEKPDTRAFFRQPGGMIEVAKGVYKPNPRAENVQNLRAGYYENQVREHKHDRNHIKSKILNLWTPQRDGVPVFDAEWNDELHMAPGPFEPTPGLPIVLGLDAGLTPAAVLAQLQPDGQWLVFDELVAPPEGQGAVKFSESLRRLLTDRYPRWLPALERLSHDENRLRLIEAWGDPAASARSSTDEQVWLAVVQSGTGIPTRAAPTNSLTLRLESVRRVLSRLIDGRPGFLLSPRCRHLRKGFNSGYRFKRAKRTGTQPEKTEPEKNEYSHVHDALQYLLLGGGEHRAVLDRDGGARAARRQVRAIEDDTASAEYAALGQRDRAGQAYAIE